MYKKHAQICGFFLYRWEGVLDPMDLISGYILGRVNVNKISQRTPEICDHQERKNVINKNKYIRLL